MAKKPVKELSTPGILITLVFYVVSFPYTLDVAATAAGTGEFLRMTVFIAISLIILGFEYNHVDEYSSQRGEQFNIASIISFFILSILLLNSVMEK